MIPADPYGLLSTREAAVAAGVSPQTIHTWHRRGRLDRAGLDERGRPLWDRAAVLEAERRVRANGIAASGIDPRQLRGRSAAPAAA